MSAQLSKPDVSSVIPFALRSHEPALVEPKESLGRPQQKWSWTPEGGFKPEQLEIYASGGMSTTRTTGVNQWDHGEFY
jgi:hypothetical protein